MTRRRYVAASAAAASRVGELSAPRAFRLWAIGDPHVGTDVER